MPDLSCVIVHWNVPDLLAECLSTLSRELELLRRRGVETEVFVVDNRSTASVRETMRQAAPPGVRYLWLPDNEGYPRAANAGYAASRAPFVLVSNPDVLFRPGCLSELLEAMGEPAVALAAPCAFWDRDLTLKLNPGFPEDQERITRDAEVKRSGTWPRHALAWQAKMVDTVFAPAPRAVEILSAACILVRREAITDAGGLFDPALFLYYDDADLCRRLADRGYRLSFRPQASIVHLFNQSGRADVGEHMERSRRYFLEKHYGREEGRRLARLHAESAPQESEFEEWGLVDLGELERPPGFEWEAEEGAIFTLGLNPQIVPAAIALLQRNRVELSAGLWAQLGPGTYYARATDASSARVLAYWRFGKGGP